jgi:hypothetical protein
MRRKLGEGPLKPILRNQDREALMLVACRARRAGSANVALARALAMTWVALKLPVPRAIILRDRRGCDETGRA